MTMVTLQSRNGECTYTKEFEADKTILHVKEYLKSQMRGDALGSIDEGIRIILNGKTVSDAVQLCTLGNGSLHLTYDMPTGKDCRAPCEKESRIFSGDVETNEISVKVAVAVSVKETGAKMLVDPEDLVVFNGQIYLVKERRRILTLKAVADLLGSIRVTKEDLVRLMVFFLLLYTGNGGVVFVLGCVFLLDILSRKLSSAYQGCFKNMDHLCRSFYMFFASLFLIDHNRF